MEVYTGSRSTGVSSNVLAPTLSTSFLNPLTGGTCEPPYRFRRPSNLGETPSHQPLGGGGVGILEWTMRWVKMKGDFSDKNTCILIKMIEYIYENVL